MRRIKKETIFTTIFTVELKQDEVDLIKDAIKSELGKLGGAFTNEGKQRLQDLLVNLNTLV